MQNAKAVIHEPEMNRNEAKYSDHLRLLWLAKEIQWYGFQPWKFRLAGNTFYTPDFGVVTKEGFLEAHDCKGRKMKPNSAGGKTASYWCEEDAKIKIKIAAEMHPMKFVIVFQGLSGEWCREEF